MVVSLLVFSFQNTLPAISLKLSALVERLKAGYKAFTVGNFGESRQEFDFILRAVPLVIGESRAEGSQLKEVRYSVQPPRPLLVAVSKLEYDYCARRTGGPRVMGVGPLERYGLIRFCFD